MTELHEKIEAAIIAYCDNEKLEWKTFSFFNPPDYPVAFPDETHPPGWQLSHGVKAAVCRDAVHAKEVHQFFKWIVGAYQDWEAEQKRSGGAR